MSDIPVLPRREFTSPPVTVPVDTTPVRVGVLNPPYTLINLGTATTQTIWLADNPGVQVNQGTPLYAGTSLQWNRPGSLWAVGESAVLLLVSYDVTDWEANPVALATAILNSGIILVDDPLVVMNHDLLGVASTAVIDTSNYQSMSLAVFPSAGVGAYPAYTTVTVDFLADNALVNSRRLDMPAGTFWRGHLPLMGNEVVISNSVGTIDISLVLSHRPFKLLQESISGTGIANTLLAEAVTIGAGVSINRVLNPYIGDVLLSIASINNGSPAVTYALVEHSINGVNRLVSRFPFGALLGTVSESRNSYTFTGEASRLTIFNGDAAARLFNIFLKPIGSFGADF